jgi:hypothetical protein
MKDDAHTFARVLGYPHIFPLFGTYYQQQKAKLEFRRVYLQSIRASAPDRRAHSEAFRPLWLQIGETTISHYAGPNINGFVEYVAYSDGVEFFQVQKLTSK